MFVEEGFAWRVDGRRGCCGRDCVDVLFSRNVEIDALNENFRRKLEEKDCLLREGVVGGDKGDTATDNVGVNSTGVNSGFQPIVSDPFVSFSLTATVDEATSGRCVGTDGEGIADELVIWSVLVVPGRKLSEELDFLNNLLMKC
jgi:hypothetical protein